MNVIQVPNVNHALYLAMAHFSSPSRSTFKDNPRGAETEEWDNPVMTVYHRPQECILFDPVRDANPFFHLFEAMWILAGRQDVRFLAHFLPRMADFSDDGHTFHAPYGYRLRRRWGDQLLDVGHMLRAEPNTRRAVCSIWDPHADLGTRSKDVPCNDLLMFRVRNGALDLTVCNRSNDVILGAYGANAVQFSFILQWMSAFTGIPIGRYYQMSNSFHVYLNEQYNKIQAARTPFVYDPYDHLSPETQVSPMPLGDVLLLDIDLSRWFHEFDAGKDPSAYEGYRSEWTQNVLVPAWTVYTTYKVAKSMKSYQTMDEAIWGTKLIAAEDWRLAMREWLERRKV